MLTASSMPLPNSMISLAAREPIGVPALADAVLAQRSQAGDRDAFARLAERHEEAVFRLAWRILRHREDAEDAAQETFLRAWRSLGRFDSRREFRPWLLRIAVNAALAMAEKRSLPQRNWGDEAPIESVPGPEGNSPLDQSARRELLEAVEDLVAGLPPEQAALFQLRYGENLSLEEIARIMDRKPGALATALHRLRERFQRALHHFLEAEPS